MLLDIVMPELDGMSVLEEMKADPVLRDVPVIMISALDDFDSVVRCIELGAEDYLPKPFDPVLLRARINAGLGRRMLYELERARVHDVFARFLPESIVTEVLARTDGGARLGGVRLIGTVLFTDLRGFTTFAEHTAPDRVIDVLNRFLSEMSDAVLDNGGTLVSYLGDGLLAVFGAPIECDDHADRALAAAREMLHLRLPRFNDWLGEEEHARRLCDGRRGQQWAADVRQRRLRAQTRVHGNRRHRQHRVTHRGAHEGSPSSRTVLRLDAGAADPARRPGHRRRLHAAGQDESDAALGPRVTGPASRARRRLT